MLLYNFLDRFGDDELDLISMIKLVLGRADTVLGG